MLRITAHHVGGRDGGGGFRVPQPFRTDLIHVYHEPATDAHGDMALSLQSFGGEGHILPYALADQTGDAVFHICYDPYMSSLLPWSEARAFAETAYQNNSGVDYTAEMFRTIESGPIGVFRLDGLAEIIDGRVPPPDVLTLDTQGTERAIIAGARGVLDGTVAVRSEVLFDELYEGQDTFASMQSELRDAGFIFIRFENLGGLEPFRFPIGFRGAPMHTQADALFLRPPSFFAPEDPQLAKLAFVAHVLGEHAIGFAAMQRFIDAALDEGPAYRQFLRELTRAAAAMPDIMPPAFTEIYPNPEASALRFDATRHDEFMRRREESIAPLKQRAIDRQHDLVVLYAAGSTPLEDVFRTWELAARADALAERRRADVTAMLGQLDLGLRPSD